MNQESTMSAHVQMHKAPEIKEGIDNVRSRNVILYKCNQETYHEVHK